MHAGNRCLQHGGTLQGLEQALGAGRHECASGLDFSPDAMLARTVGVTELILIITSVPCRLFGTMHSMLVGDWVNRTSC